MAINYDFKNLAPFKWFILENFPFIEADFHALTNWQLFCELGKEMNKLIESQNNVGQQTELLTNAFNDLYNYVNNYFENLDVQDEINNKLDVMAENGTLENIIESYLNSRAYYGYNTVADMLSATNLVNGSYAKTLGYYSINDGGGASYKITNDENLTVDNIFVLQLNSGLKAQTIVENEILNVMQFGAKNDNSVDISSILNALVASSYNSIFFPQGQYLLDNKVALKSNMNLHGVFNGSNINLSMSSISLLLVIKGLMLS